jgi:uncharacterized protein (TIGR03435 family)
MKANLALGIWLVYTAAASHSQDALTNKRLTFDAASVKAATLPPGVTINAGNISSPRREDILKLQTTGGPGTNDPGRIHYPVISLKRLLDRAYEPYFEIKGPGWLDSEMLQVDATMPPQTTKEQFREMLRNLITDRFGLKYHLEIAEISGYSLVVAKTGSRMHESLQGPPPDGDASKPAPGPGSIAPDGFPIWPTGRTGTGFQTMPGSRARIVSRQETMEGLSRALGTLLKTKVVDATGLTAKYDFTVTYSDITSPALSGSVPAQLSVGVSPTAGSLTPAPADLPDIFSALQSQIGLRLQPKKVSVEVVVIDQIQKTPVVN